MDEFFKDNFMKRVKNILFITSIIFFCSLIYGCNKASIEYENIEKTNGEEKPFELVSVNEFKEYYDIADDEISDEIIENYIFDYTINDKKLRDPEYFEILKEIIAVGEENKLGYNLRHIRGARYNIQKNFEEYIYDAKWIYINIYYPSTTEFVGPGENMVIDLKNKKIYSNSKEDDYREAECSSDLTDEMIEEIRREFPKCMSDENQGTKRCGYTYEVFIVDAKKNGIKYEKYDGENYNVSFDTYWKGLYEESFKKKHVPNKDIKQ